MWVRADDEINAAINQPTGEFALFVSDSFAVFSPPMNKANNQIGVCARIGDRNVQLPAIRCGCDLGAVTKSTDREESDSFSIGQREKPRTAGLPASYLDSDWLNFLPKQARCGIVQCNSPKIERVVVCQAHCAKACMAESFRGSCRSAERIFVRGRTEIRNGTFQVCRRE